VVHRELAVPQPVRHRRLDVLSAGSPLGRIAGAQVHHAAPARLVVRQPQLAADVLGQQPQHRRLRRRRHGGELVQEDDDEVAVLGEALRLARPGHGQQAHPVRRGHRKTAEVLWLPNRPDQDHHLASDPGALEPRLEALRELRLPDAREAGHVHRDASLQSYGDELYELPELHSRTPPGTIDTAWHAAARVTTDFASAAREKGEISVVPGCSGTRSREVVKLARSPPVLTVR
jgi:hypothetical protein